MKRQQGSIYPKGFTLIELLVVVLIIGILAAVALPQYQKAVQKARFTEALTNIHTLQQAAQAYALSHSELTGTQELTNQLDIEVSSQNFTYMVLWDSGICEDPEATFLHNGETLQISANNDSYSIISEICNNHWDTYCLDWEPNQNTPGTRMCELFNQLYPQN